MNDTEKTFDNEVIEEEMINCIKSPTISYNDVGPYIMIYISLLTGKNKCNRGWPHKNRRCFDELENTTVLFKK